MFEKLSCQFAIIQIGGDYMDFIVDFLVEAFFELFERVLFRCVPRLSLTKPYRKKRIVLLELHFLQLRWPCLLV